MAIDWSNAPKDPEAKRDYGLDWALDIGATTITASVWEVVSGDIVIESDSFTDTKTAVRLTGGTVGTGCTVKNHIVLSSGEEDEYSGEIEIVER